MVYSVEDRILIENLYKFRNYCAKKLIRKFPGKGWTVSGVNKLLRKLRNTGSTRRRQESGRPRSACNDDNVDSVNELILSQEGAPESQNHTSNFTRDRNSSLFSIPYRSSEFEVAPNSRTTTATSFPSIRCGLHIFH